MGMFIFCVWTFTIVSFFTSSQRSNYKQLEQKQARKVLNPCPHLPQGHSDKGFSRNEKMAHTISINDFL